MDKFKEIRPIVLGIIKKDNKILAMKGEGYYRLLGGGVEFLETLETALKREFKEELNTDIKINKYIGFEDNIFVYKGKNAHEHMFVYDIEILDEYKEVYEFDEIDMSGNIIHNTAVWVDVDELKQKRSIIYPEITLKYI